MDYLDPNKQFRHRIILFIGYIFIAFGITIATLILVYFSYGFGFSRNGAVIQNGLVFFSSQPNPASIYLNGKLNSAKTDTRLNIPSGIYKTQLQRTGYRNWQRTLDVNGGRVLHVDYPLLIPTLLKTNAVTSYAATPAMVSQSIDRRWVLVQQPGSINSFDLYDIKPKVGVKTVVTLPSTLLTKSSGAESLQSVAWADDNQHVLIKHVFNGGVAAEYILLDRADVTQSQNLNTIFGIALDEVTFQNSKFNQYFLYSAQSKLLQSVSLNNTVPVVLLDHVLAYKTLGDSTFLYVTDNGAPAGKVFVNRTAGSKTVTLRQFPSGSTYLVDFAKYSGVEYDVMGSVNENKIYIYRDAAAQLRNQPKHAIVPQQVLHVATPNFLSFSPSFQFIVAEHDKQFGVYDIENSTGYNYSLQTALDAPQTHVTWMDGSRFTTVSNGSSKLFDYDGTNVQTLVPTTPNYVPFYTPDYKYFYSFQTTTTGESQFGQTSLLIPADQ